MARKEFCFHGRKRYFSCHGNTYVQQKELNCRVSSTHGDNLQKNTYSRSDMAKFCNWLNRSHQI